MAGLAYICRQPYVCSTEGATKLDPAVRANSLKAWCAGRQAGLHLFQQAGFSSDLAVKAFYGMIQCIIGTANLHLYIS